MSKKYSKGRKYYKSRNTKRRNAKSKRSIKHINTKRRNTLRRGKKNKVTNHKIINNLAKQGKIINGYKIITRLNYHKSSIKYGGNCDDIVSYGFSCIKDKGKEILLGRGNQGYIYLVKKDKKEYAMKITSLEFYEKEVNILSKLKGIRNVCKYATSWKLEDESSGIIIMDYLGKVNLDSLFDKINENQMWKYVVQLAIALKELHNRKLFHNDISASNIMIKDGDAYLIDFGLATENHSICSGAPKILPPDKLMNRDGDHCREQHDIYSLGIVMFLFVKCNGIINFMINKNDNIKKSLSTGYNVSDNYKKFIIDIIDGKINTANDILLQLPIDVLSELHHDILSQIIVIKVNILYGFEDELYRLEDEIKKTEGKTPVIFEATKNKITQLHDKKNQLQYKINSIIISFKYCNKRGSDDYTNYCEVMINAFIYNELKRNDSLRHDILDEIKERHTTQQGEEPDLVTMTQLIRRVVTQDELVAANNRVKKKLSDLKIHLARAQNSAAVEKLAGMEQSIEVGPPFVVAA